MKPKTISIHGNDYVPVHERVRVAHEANDEISITTEFLPIEGVIVCKATVETKKGTFHGTSAANMSKAIEKASPYEVAESSAIGRALGFAGYGIADGIASAEEVEKAVETPFSREDHESAVKMATITQIKALTAILGSGLAAFEKRKGALNNLTHEQAQVALAYFQDKQSQNESVTNADLVQTLGAEL